MRRFLRLCELSIVVSDIISDGSVSSYIFDRATLLEDITGCRVVTLEVAFICICTKLSRRIVVVWMVVARLDPPSHNSHLKKLILIKLILL